jgi:alpha-tubulin suppressor-like RCC1 family protein
MRFIRYSLFGLALSICLLAAQTLVADCVSALPGLIGWWPGDGNANNVLGTNNGTLQGGATANGAGQVATAFGFDGTNGFVQIPDSPLLRPTNLTIEAWVSFASLDSAGSGGSPAGDQYIVFRQNSRSSDFEGFDLSKTRVGGSDVFRFLISSATAQTVEIHSTTTINTGVWYHVAAVRGSNFTQIYVNGNLERQTNISFPQDYGSFPLYFGTSGQSYWDHKLKGNLDEVSLYNRALSASEIAAIYSAGSAGKCKAPTFVTQPQSQSVVAGSDVTFTVSATGFGTLSYQWRSNDVAISAATNSALTLSNAQPAFNADYSIVVTNWLGAVTSAVATLTVIAPPNITNQPQNVTTMVFSNATFSVSAAGSSLFYQWLKNGTNLATGGNMSGVTGSVLTILSPQLSDAGQYSVVVSNIGGAVASSNATLTVLPVFSWGQGLLPPANATGLVAITSGKAFDLAIRDDGSVIGWGDNSLGQTTPPATFTNPAAIAGGEWHSLGLQQDGSIVPWGWNNYNDTIPPAGATNLVAIAAGQFQSFAVRQDGQVFAWGSDFVGETDTPPNASPAIAVAGWGWWDSPINPHSLALRLDGLAVGWGQNNYGQSSPTSGNGLVAIAAGSYHSLGLQANSTVVGWGRNDYGQCTPPPNATNVVAIAAGDYHSLALRADGTVVAWGYNVDGESTVPVGITNVVAIAAKSYRNLVLVQDPATHAPPKFWQQPFDYVLLSAGQTVIFNSQAVGSLPLRFQWYWNGTPLAGQTNRWLAFTAAQLNQRGEYQVVVTNSFGSSTSQVARLLTPPLIVTQPASQTVLAGSNVNFSVLATGNGPLSYQWYFNGNTLTDTARINGSTSANLSISNLDYSDTGNYSVVVSDMYGSATSSVATLTVPFPPGFSQQPQDLFTNAGTGAGFSATVTGTPPIALQWFFNDAPLTDGGRISGSATANLTVSNLQTNDSGPYWLVASNFAGMATSSVATLTVVIPPPVITTQPLGRSVPPGFSTVFMAAASGSGLAYQWQLNGTNILGATQTSYTNPAVSLNNVGAYQVIVSNGGGSVTSSVALLTIGPVAAWGNNQQGQCIVPPGLSNVIAIAGGINCSLALRGDGSVVAWGNGAGTNLPPGLTNIVAIAAGSSDSAVALRSDGALVSWNSSVNGTNFANSLSNIVALAAGFGFDVAIRAEGIVRAWVANGAFPGSPPQVVIPAGLTKVISIAAGVNQSIALRDDGTVAVWGTGTTTNVPGPLTNVVAVGSGFNHVIVLKADGRLSAWGTGASVNTPANLTNVAAIAVGSYAQGQSHDLAILSNNTVVVWGDNGFGETNTPSALSNLVTVAVAGGGYHSLALVNDGMPLILRPPVGGTFFSGRDVTLSAKAVGALPLRYQWLRNGTNLPGATQSTLSLSAITAADATSYQIVVSNALGLAASVPAPVTVLDGAPFFIQQPVQTNYAYLATKFSLSSVVGGSGPRQFTWLFNGQILPAPASDTLTFPRVQVTNSGAYTLIVSNSFGSVTSLVANLTVLSVVAWGAFDIFYNETNVPASLTNPIAISAGPGSSLALRADGTALAWGHYQNGETNIPASLSNLVEVVAGNGFNLALRADGQVLGFGNFSTNALTTLSNIIALEADNNGTTFLRGDGTIARMSPNYGLSFPLYGTNVVALNHYIYGYGLLRADGTVLLSPNIKVPAASNIMQMAASFTGDDEELFLRRNGSLFGAGRLVGAPGVSNAIDIAANTSVGAAVRPDGTVGAWGAVGASTNVPFGLANVTVLDAGQSHFMALLKERVFPPVFLSDALNTSALVVSSKSSAQWFGQRSISHDGQHAAQSAPVDRNTASSMRALVTGPITVRFWWKVSSETNHDFLTFSVGGSPQAAISGEQDWQQVTFSVPAGPQMLVWTYSKDDSGSAGLDTSWVDQLELIPIAPSIVSQPVSQTVLGGTNVTLSVIASGTPPLNYQWRKNEVTLTNQYAASLVLTNVTRTNSGSYSVVITNFAGSITSSNAILVVHVPQQLRQPPFPANGTFLLVSGDADGGLLSSSDVGGFHLQASTNLTDWLPIPATITLTNGLLQIQDTNTATFRYRFYRVVEDW